MPLFHLRLDKAGAKCADTRHLHLVELGCPNPGLGCLTPEACECTHKQAKHALLGASMRLEQVPYAEKHALAGLTMQLVVLALHGMSA